MNVHTELTNDEINEALTKSQSSDIIMSLRVLWSVIKNMTGDIEFKKWKRSILFGNSSPESGETTLNFDLRNVIYGEVEEYYDSNNILIRGFKKTNIQTYWDEMEKRETLMKELIRKQYDDGEQEEEDIEGHD